MRIFKRVLAVVLVCMMILPLGMSSFAAWNLDDAVTVNWTPMAAKYSKGTWKLIAPKSENYEIRTNNFGFSKDENGGIAITTPTYEEFAGTYGVSVISSKATTALDGLSVVIQPNEFDSYVDSIDAGNSLNILWTEDKIDTLADFNDDSKSYDAGLYTAVDAYSNGLRHIIRPANTDVKLTPASKAPAGATNGKALMVRVTCDKPIGEDLAPVATSVSIIYYDGYYINDDGHPGYRWTFTAKNHEDGSLGDASSISTGFESIDLSNGLAVNVRADERLGFIVNINGYDFYKGEEIGFFPDCDTNWVGYTTNNLKDEQILNNDPIWTTSMTYARADIDLSGLRDAAEGHVIVGAVSNNDQTNDAHRCNYTVESINGVAAADWAGETTPAHECSFELVGTIGTTCTRDGRDYYRCSVCGKADNRNIQPAFGHTPKEDITEIIKPTCTTYGTSSRNCYVCKVRLETYHDAPGAHTFENEWTIIEAPTCEKEGKRTNTCSVCAAVVEEIIPAHNFEWVVKTEATCLAAGSETQVCKDCGTEGETREIPSDNAHKFEASTPVIETIDGATDWFGKVAGVCTVCGEVAESTEDMYAHVSHFTDVKENHWFMSEVAFCVRQGYVSGMTETTFAPNNNLTRAQFLTLLAKYDGVDLEQYKGKDAGFEDVKPDYWFNEVVCWAVENEYTSGISETKFGPSNNITRSQLARFFQVYTEKEGFDVSKEADLSVFPDAGKVQEWALPSVKWAVAEGLIAGSNGNLDPNGNATRAQAARIFMMYANTEFAVVEPPVCEHVWGEWVVTLEPTTEAAGEETATCTLCGETKTQEIPPVEDVKDFTITFALYDEDITAGAKIDGTDETSVSYGINNGDHYVDLFEYPTATKEGYDFVGWLLEDYGFMLTYDEYAGNYYALTGDCTVYAIFEEIVPEKDWKITFDPNGGVMPEGVPTEMGINTNENYKEATGYDYPVPTLEGYVFAGWFWEAFNFTLTEGDWNGGWFAVSQDVDLVALWEEAPVVPEKDYTIRLFIEDEWLEMGAKIDGTDATEIFLPINYGDDYNDAIGDFPTATLEGYDFMGWFLESYGFMMNEDEWNGNSYALTSDCELYAIFEESAPELPLYNENGVDGYLTVGTADYELSADYQYTIFEFCPEEEGKYIIATDSLVGIASYNGMWVTVEPSADTVTEASVAWECTGVGQTIWVAVKGGAATANITVTKEDIDPEPEIEYVEYENVVTPAPFTFDGDAAALVNVAYNDDFVDTAVLGDDGFYHLNSVDGPVLYVNLADPKMDLSAAMSYGQLKSSVEENGVVVKIISYYYAYEAYTLNADNNLYPLTVDLMEILQKVGEYQGWYEGDSAWVATTEDAWMFACYYAPAAVEPEPEAKEFTLVFNGEDGAIVNDAALTYTIKLGDSYADVIAELPVAEKDGYVFKGWWNRERRIALNGEDDGAFDVFLKDSEVLDEIDTTIELIPIWDTEGEKDWTLTFINWEIDFEPIVIGANVGDTYMSLFGGKYPDPGETVLDFDGDLWEFQGWMIDHPDVGVFLLTEGDMWDLGYLALAGNWTFEALYELV